MKSKFKIIADFCKEEKLCSLNEAFKLSKKFNSSEIDAAIIVRNDLSYIGMLKFLEEIELSWITREAIILRGDFEEFSYKMMCDYSIISEAIYSGGFAVGVNYTYSETILKSMFNRGILKQFALPEILDYLKKTNYSEEMLIILQENPTWKTSSFEEMNFVLEKHDHNINLVKFVIASSSCSLVEGIELMKKTDDPLDVSYTLIEKKEFHFTDLLFELSIAFKSLIGSNFESIWALAHRDDCNSIQAIQLMDELIGRNAEPDEIQEVAMAIVKKPDTSFEVALETAKRFDYNINIVEVFQKREVFTIPERYELIGAMNGHVPYMYEEKGEEPSYDSYDYGKIIKAADWSTGTLSEMFLLSQDGVARGKIMERDDWKNLSYEASLVLAKDVYYKREVVSCILERPYFDFRKSLKLLKKSNCERHHWWVLSTIVKTSGCTFSQALSLLKYCSTDDYSTVLISIADNPDFRLMQVSQILLNGYSSYMNIIGAVYRHKGWTTESLKEIFALLGKDIMYTNETVNMIIQRVDWQKLTFAEAQEYLSIGNINQDSQYFEYFLPTMLVKKDCSGKDAVRLIENIDFGKEFSKKIVTPVLAKSDLSISEVLRVSEKTLFGTYAEIVKRHDWKELPKSVFMEHLRDHKEIALYDSVVKRTDWKELSFEQALTFFDEKPMCSYRYAEYLGKVISLKDCSLNQAVQLAEENNYGQAIISAIIARDDCTLEKAVDLAMKSQGCDRLMYQIFEAPYWKSASVEVALEIARRKFDKVNCLRMNVVLFEQLSKLDSWLYLSTSEKLDYLEKEEYTDSILGSIRPEKEADAVVEN